MRSPARFALFCALLLVAPSAPIPWAVAQTGSVTIAVDAAADRRPIDPRIYGVAYADESALSDLNVPLHRRGGNNTTRYNWQQNADNRANDWYYQSIAYPSATPGADADAFISSTLGAGAEAAVTIPTIGWVAKLGPNRSKTSSFSIAKYGPQTGNDWQWFPDAGNGVRTSGGFVTGNDPNDASVPADHHVQRAWVDHLVGRWGAAAAGGVRYYILDNEPSIWHATHRDVHPVGATMDEVLQKTIDYATAIKAADPGALVVGPEEWGWSGYIWSGFDQQAGAANGWTHFPDREAHGNWDYLPWLLDQLRQRHDQTGTRLLDVFTVHYYPQGGEFSDDVSTSMQLRRNRSTRSLWDPAYTDESWINDEVRLVPRLREWVASYYPGTKTGITEYNWGAEGHINGATAQADILGIFGREGLDMAARWTTPAASTPTYKAMKLYRNYDGAGSTFGDVSVRATAPSPDTLSAFAAERTSDGALTVMIVNKALSSSSNVTVSLAGFTPAGVAQAWQLTSANAITRLADVGVPGSSLTATVPAQSVTLFVLPRAASADTPGIYVGSAGAWFLRNESSPGPGALSFFFGPASAAWQPLAGDWDGDGVSSPGLYDPSSGTVFLKNSSANGPADITFIYGPPSSTLRAIAGDWDGDGDDTVGLYDPANGAFFLRNVHDGGTADVSLLYGPPGVGWRPLAGDWDGDGDDTVGLYDPASGTFFLRNANAPGPADVTFIYGAPGMAPLAGDWDGDGDDTVGIYSPAGATWFLRNTSSSGAADMTFIYGAPNATPLAGNWDGQ